MGGHRLLWDQGGYDETDDWYTMLPKPFIGSYQILRQRAAYQDLSRMGVEHGTATFLVNAAIMNENSYPGNAPWLLDFDLPAK
jgi:hypothetical protein